MKPILLRANLAAIAAWAVLSVVGGFLGAERAAQLFNSVPLVVFWFGLLVLLTASLAGFRRVLRSPGLLALHLGSALILVGAMLGSRPAHDLAAKLFGSEKLRSGYMPLVQGLPSDAVSDGEGRVAGRLPFHLKLKQFRVEYYEPTWPWHLVVAAPTGAGEMTPNLIAWQVGRVKAIPGTDWQVKVMEYVSSARALRAPEGAVIAVEPAPSAGAPAMRVALIRGGERREVWLVGDKASGRARRPVMLPGAATGPGARATPAEGGTEIILFLMKPPGEVKSCQSDVAVMRFGDVVGESTIAVNHPLHYGGYHFYQYSYDPDFARFSVLSVTSDSGLWAVYAGFVLLCAGAFAWCWLHPAWLIMRERATDGDKV